MNREQAEMSMLITFEPPSGPMQKEAVEAGWYHSDGWQRVFPRCQIFTIAELLSGQRPELPYGRQSFAKAERITVPSPQQIALLPTASPTAPRHPTKD